MELIPHEIQITADKIKKFTFPIYVPPNVKDDMVRCRLISHFIKLDIKNNKYKHSRCMKPFFVTVILNLDIKDAINNVRDIFFIFQKLK